MRDDDRTPEVEEEESCTCGCGHHHHPEKEHRHEEHHHHEHDDDDCDCGHHHHDDDDDDDCGCGHHHHDDDDDDDCGCGHHHHHDHGSEPSAEHKHIEGAVTQVFLVNNLGCAHCASKMEAKISRMPEVASCTLTYATKQLRVEAAHPLELLPRIQQICASIESEVTVTPRAARGETKREVQEDGDEEKRDLVRIITGTAALVIGKVLEHFLPATGVLPCNIAALILFVVGYVYCGWGVLKQAAVNIAHGRALDENFLMSIATLGAFAIGDYAEALGVMVFYRVGEYFEDKAVEKSRSNIMEALDLRPEVVNLMEGGEVRTIPAEDALPGDEVLVRPGDRVPLDGTVLEGESLLDTSAITGEPVPVAVRPGDSVTSGCVNQNGALTVRVEKELSESMVTRIMDSVENAAAAKPHIDRFISRFCKVYTPLVVALAVLTALIPSIVTGNWGYWVKTALTFLVISCPCALVLSVPLAFFAGIGLGSKKNVLFKGGSAMEAICNVKAIVMDKTGTLTRGVFTVQRILPADGVSETELLAMAAKCESASTHPIAQSIRAAAGERGVKTERPESIQELSGLGIDADGILCGNRKLLEQYGIAVPADDGAFGTEVLLADHSRYLGRIVISDELKPETRTAIAALKAEGLKTVMLTGDAADSAEAVAREIGLDEVHAKLLPQDKLRILKETREKYGPVMFVGDGINDAPVLAGADVGAAMGSGADAAIEAADVVFMNSDMSAIPQAIQIARRTRRISWQNVYFALAVKIVVMALGLLGYANMWIAVFADTGVSMLCLLNSIRILYHK